MPEGKPKEWWIREGLDYHDDGGVYDTQEMSYYIHVIEYEVYNEAIKERDLAEANEMKWAAAMGVARQERDALQESLREAYTALKSYSYLPDGDYAGPDDLYCDLGRTAFDTSNKLTEKHKWLKEEK